MTNSKEGSVTAPTDVWSKELAEAFHDLWSRDVGTPGYDKSKWKRLEAEISKLRRGSP